eukprot:TRINITY_DN16279_c0_g1_i1.p1 TRINITY_DN16279_c0_g1~~TRINITY_DN16279_c0_g1_i1.p1  ORF type:complete len:61 (-),score=12.28 TRINITY_DN16279_c0_g1_i1:355-537(-)
MKSLKIFTNFFATTFFTTTKPKRLPIFLKSKFWKMQFEKFLREDWNCAPKWKSSCYDRKV